MSLVGQVNAVMQGKLGHLAYLSALKDRSDVQLLEEETCAIASALAIRSPRHGNLATLVSFHHRVKALADQTLGVTRDALYHAAAAIVRKAGHHPELLMVARYWRRAAPFAIF